METPKTIRIPNPSIELIAFMEKVQKQKKARMEMMRERFFQSQS